MNVYLKNIFRFCILLMLQVIVLNKITLHWFTSPSGALFNPLIYPLFILLLPFETPVWVLLILGFLMGLAVDSFMNTAGMHAAALILLAYLRTNVLNALLPRNPTEYVNMEPSVKNMGWSPFLVFCGFLLLLHHIVFFSLESWGFNSIGALMLKIATSFITSMVFILIYVLLFTRQHVAKSH